MTEATSGTAAHVHGSNCICCEAGDAIRRVLQAISPSENVSAHFRQSGMEFLKGLRALLDERIDHIGREPHKGTRVVVE